MDPQNDEPTPDLRAYVLSLPAVHEPLTDAQRGLLRMAVTDYAEILRRRPAASGESA